MRKRAIQISRGRAFQAKRIASAKALRGSVPGNEISAAGGQREAGREQWEARSGHVGPHRHGRHIICQSNFENKRGCINNYAQVTGETCDNQNVWPSCLEAIVRTFILGEMKSYGKDLSRGVT